MGQAQPSGRVRKYGASSGECTGRRCPRRPSLAYWWYVCGGRRPAAAGGARRNASYLWTCALVTARSGSCAPDEDTGAHADSETRAETSFGQDPRTDQESRFALLERPETVVGSVRGLFIGVAWMLLVAAPAGASEVSLSDA